MKQDSNATSNNPDVHFLDAPESPVKHTEPPGSGLKQGERASQMNKNSEKHADLSADLKTIAGTVLGIAVVISAGYLAYCSVHNFPTKSADSKLSAEAPPVVTVTVAEVKIAPVDEVLEVTGSISSWDELKVASELSGLHVKSVYVEEGDKVKRGQVLAELNAALLEAQLSQAEARLKSAEANSVKSVQPNRPEDIAALKAALEQAESTILQEKAHQGQARVNLESAELNVPRYEGLAKLGAVSAVEAETKRFARDTAKLELESAQQKVNAAIRQSEQARHKYLLAIRGGRSEDVQMTRAGLEEIKAQVKHLSEQIKQTKIRAHDDGLILQRNVHIGDTSDSSKPLFTMCRLNKLELRAQVNDVDLPKFHRGQDVLISTNEHEEPTCTGKVRLVSPQVDAGSRLGTVRIDLPENADLKPGMFVRGEIRLSRHQGLTVPVSCVVTRAGESFVFTLAGKKAVSTRVSTGMQSDRQVEIKSGLKEGDKVIDKGARFLSDGDIVDVSG